MNYDNLIGLFGSELATLLRKPPIACKGLMRFAVIEYLKLQSAENYVLGYQDFHIIIKNHLKPRLEEAQIPNRENIIDYMLQILRKHQSIFLLQL